MGNKKNTITINGKVYDTITGEVISASLPFKHIIEPTKPKHDTKIQVTEDIVKHPVKKQVTPAQITVKNETVKKNVHRHTPGVATSLHQKTERPKTLMRNTVKKPAIRETKASAVAVSGLASQPKHKIIHSNVPERTIRASKVEKSVKVSRFAQSNTIVTQKVETIPVRVAPKKRDVQTEAVPIHSHAPPIHVAKPAEARDIFETAMQNATSHQASRIGKHHSHKKRKSRGLQFAAVAATVFLLGSFFAYNNAPNMALKKAENSTGFAARVPSYKPAGFSLNRNVQYQPGKVTIRFASNTDGKDFTITQEKTTLTNNEITTSYIPSSSVDGTAQTKNGVTVYIYDDTKATWIENGIWYNIEGSAQLSRSQLLGLASSL